MIYKFIRPLLFKFDAEVAHEFSLKALDIADRMGLLKLYSSDIANRPKTVMGITFPSNVGLAAGLDKNGDHINALSSLGFGFVEIGTVTPRPQDGNPKPRMFRLPERLAIINRMGFNNKGVDYLVEQVKKSNFKGVLGINIGKNADTPMENAVDDYLICLNKVYEYASYITINISSPNTKNLRQLQQGNEFKPLLSALKKQQSVLADKHNKYVPLVVKIAPDLTHKEVSVIAQVLLDLNMDGVIATNTTISRDAVKGITHAEEAGGLSGAPVFRQSTEVVAQLYAHLNGEIPIIAAGGIMSAEDAKEKIKAGASLVQIYSGLIYKGPELIKDIKQAQID
ncbi:MAG: quinone-dependent dihydroorotate dehydrogenase [Gammaproteobacteria bacterium]|nr:quinone-dependent dihydroorotate dehydrogenase [Gammaproteobacteria bacterium]